MNVTDSLFILVHPVLDPEVQWDCDTDAYATALARVTRGSELLLIADDDLLDAWDDADERGVDLTLAPGVLAADFDVMEANDDGLDDACADIIAGLAEDTRITVGGCHRTGAVARVATRLRTYGYTVVVDSAVTFPPAH